MGRSLEGRRYNSHNDIVRTALRVLGHGVACRFVYIYVSCHAISNA